MQSAHTDPLAHHLTHDLAHDLADPLGGSFARGWFEPCAAFEGDTDAVCVACGWLGGDHVVDADVVELPAVRPRVMRRAS
jgi:hypothetical protein